MMRAVMIIREALFRIGNSYYGRFGNFLPCTALKDFEGLMENGGDSIETEVNYDRYCSSWHFAFGLIDQLP